MLCYCIKATPLHHMTEISVDSTVRYFFLIHTPPFSIFQLPEPSTLSCLLFYNCAVEQHLQRKDHFCIFIVQGFVWRLVHGLGSHRQNVNAANEPKYNYQGKCVAFLKLNTQNPNRLLVLIYIQIVSTQKKNKKKQPHEDPQRDQKWRWWRGHQTFAVCYEKNENHCRECATLREQNVNQQPER